MKWIDRHQRWIAGAYLFVGLFFALNLVSGIALMESRSRSVINRFLSTRFSEWESYDGLEALGTVVFLGLAASFVVLVLASPLIKNRIVLWIGGGLILSVAGILLVGILNH